MSGKRLNKSISKSMILNQTFNGPLRTNSEYHNDSPKVAKVQQYFANLRSKLAIIAKQQSTPCIKKNGKSRDKKKQQKIIQELPKIDNSFELIVSPDRTSSSDTLSPEIPNNSNKMHFKAMENFKKLNTVQRQHKPKSQSSLISSPVYRQIFDYKKAQNDSYDNDRLNIQYIKALQQNQETKEVDEFYENGQLNIQINTNDIMSFLRYEQEAQELFRRQQFFTQQRQLQMEMKQELQNDEDKEKMILRAKRESQKREIQKMLEKDDRQQTLMQRQKTIKIDSIAQQFIDQNSRLVTQHQVALPNPQLNVKTYFIQKKH
ncbi:hypothetical protein pb186bvf_002013 [Paramecium bursaria]